MKMLSLYINLKKKGEFHYHTNVYSLGWLNEGVRCYIYPSKIYDELIPLYQFEKNGKFHYNTNSYSLGWLNEGIVGYVF